MLYIAHRGLLRGPNPALENSPVIILRTLDAGYDCEIDLWFNDGWWLGHDAPTYKIGEYFLENTGLWIHAKNLAALEKLNASGLNYFWHESDCFTLTSKGFIWTFPGNQLTSQSVMVMPEMVDPELNSVIDTDCYAICSDWILKIKALRSE